MSATRAILLAGIVLIGCAFDELPGDMISPTNSTLQQDSTRKEIGRLLDTAAKFYNQADYANALKAMKQALKTAEATWGDSVNTNVLEILDLTTGIYKAQGDFSNALVICNRTMQIREASYGAGHPEVAISLFALASLYNDLGNYAQALQMGQRSLQIREKAFGSEHQDVAASLAVLSQIYVNQGDYFHALAAIRQAFAYWDKHFEVNPYLAVTCLNDMASINQDLANFESSLRGYQAVSALYEKLYGTNSPSLAACWNNIGSIYEEQGKYEEALAFYQRSLSLKVMILGSEHPDIALSLNNSAKVLAKLGRHAEAMKLYERALSILEKAQGNTHPNLAVLLNNIAQLYVHQGDPSTALPLFERSLQITENARGKEHPLVASVLNNMASVYESKGEVPKALNLYGRSLVIKERSLGGYHPEVISTLRNIAVLCLEQGDTRDAIQVFADAFRRRRQYVLLQFPGATDKEAMRTIENDRFSEEMFHSLCGTELAGGRTVILGAEELALNKGTLEEVRVTQAALESDPETATQKLRQQRQAALNRLERLAKGRLEPEHQVETRSQIEASIKIIDEKLSERTPLAVLCLRDRNITISGIARSLPPESVLVDFVQFSRFDSTVKTNWWKEQRYAAYLTFPLASGSTNVVVERVDLGEAAPVNKTVELVCKRMSAGQFAAKDLTTALRRLSDLIYAPLAPYLTNVSHLIVCPDGQLSRLPFEMLPLSSDSSATRTVGSKFLIEEKTISYVTSGREVVRLARISTGSENPAYGSPIAGRALPRGASLVMGNPDFDLDLQRSGRGNEAVAQKSEVSGQRSEVDQSLLTSAATKTLSRDCRGLKFTPLPGSAAEAISVAKLLGKDVVLRLGPDAREAELKAVESPRILHLATHGFFLSDHEFSHANSLPGFGQGSIDPENNWENPLVRCGLALAGANHALQITNAIAEDGLLTGLEASLLHLQGTELVILSACDSGSGEVKIGEGVMSLRRAFRIAGAESVLASHWPVSDKATSLLMTEFMRRWQTGEPRAQAWRESQLFLRHSKDFSNPYFWAAFTLTGQWR